MQSAQSKAVISTAFDEFGYAMRVAVLYAVTFADIVANTFLEPPTPTLLSVLVLFMCVSAVLGREWRLTDTLGAMAPVHPLRAVSSSCCCAAQLWPCTFC